MDLNYKISIQTKEHHNCAVVKEVSNIEEKLIVQFLFISSNSGINFTIRTRCLFKCIIFSICEKLKLLPIFQKDSDLILFSGHCKNYK